MLTGKIATFLLHTVIPTTNTLAHLLKDLLVSGDTTLKARAENFLFEERISLARQQNYEQSCELAEAEYELWLERHVDFLHGAIYQQLPQTFLALNDGAALSKAVSSGLGETQQLIRLESLNYALEESKIGTLAELEHILAVYQGTRHDPALASGEPKAALLEICRSLNRNPNAVRPRFAAFAEELAVVV